MDNGTGTAVKDRPQTLPCNDSKPYASPPAPGSPDPASPLESWLPGESVSSRPLFALSDRELATELDEVFAAEQKLAARRLALIAEIDARGVAVRDGARNTAMWLGERLRLDAGRARESLRLARALSVSLSATAEALADGRIHLEQAQIIEKAVSHLPDSVGSAICGQAEHALIEFAGTFAPSPLAALGGRILGHVAPEVAEEHERRQLEREEARAWKERCFTIAPHGPARHRVSGWLDNESAATVNAALDALCKPPSTRDTSGISPAQQRADALVVLCRMAMGGGSLPTNGGQRPQVFVMMPFQSWQEAAATAMGTLGDGRKVTPETVRRMACDADLAPIVLGSDSEVLDVGRVHRLVTPAIRKALIVRDGGCAFPGCDRPAAWTDAHHRTHWMDGGITSLDTCVLLCRRHHVIVHEGQWQIRLGPDRLPEFIPPAFVDPLQRPRRNPYHRRT